MSAPQQPTDLDHSTRETLSRPANHHNIPTSSFLGPRITIQDLASDHEEESMSPININDWNSIYMTLKPAFLDKKRKRKEAEKAEKFFNDQLAQLIQLSNVTDVEALIQGLNN